MRNHRIVQEVEDHIVRTIERRGWSYAEFFNEIRELGVRGLITIAQQSKTKDMIAYEILSNVEKRLASRPTA